MCGGQEEPDRLQGLQAQEVPHGRHVQVRIQVFYARMIFFHENPINLQILKKAVHF
jgi:hypothetical protein